MIILHNSYDKESRGFIASHGISAIIHDWYKGGREEFWAAGNTHGVSAFPSVIIDIPSHRAPAIIGPPAAPGRLVPRQQLALRKPADMAEVQAFLDQVNIELAKSAGEGLPIEPLTLDNASKRKM